MKVLISQLSSPPTQGRWDRKRFVIFIPVGGETVITEKSFYFLKTLGLLGIDSVRLFCKHTYVFEMEEIMITASALRGNIYRLLDQVVDNGRPLTVSRRSTVLKISRVEPSAKLERLVRHDCIKGDPETLVHFDWESEWKHDLP